MVSAHRVQRPVPPISVVLSRCAAALCVAALVPLASGCKPSPLPGENAGQTVAVTNTAASTEVDTASLAPLLEIGGRVLTIGEFESRAALMSEIARAKLDVTQSRTSLLEMFVWVELLAALGTDSGLVGGAEEALFGLEVEARANLADDVARSLDVSTLEPRWRAAFEAQHAEWERPAQRKVRGITLPDRALAEQVRADMVAGLEHTDAEHVFRSYNQALATGDSTDGAWGWVVDPAHGGLGDPALLDVIFSVEPSTLSPVFASTRGWEIVYVEGVDEGLTLTFEDAEAYVRSRVLAMARGEHMRSVLDASREAAGVSVDTAAVARLAALRTREPADTSRPRRYAQEALASAYVTELGVDLLNEVNEERAARVSNPSVQSVDPPVHSLAPEGSGAPLMTP